MDSVQRLFVKGKQGSGLNSEQYIRLQLLTIIKFTSQGSD